MPKLIALRESPVARETSAIPPRPMVIASEAASTRLVRSLSSPASRSNLCLMAFSLSSMPHSLAHSLPLYNLYFLTTPKGLMEDPELSPCWELLAQVYRKIHPYQEIPELLKALSIPKADSKRVIIYRARALNAIGHYEEALADLIRIIELEPQNIRAIIELGITYGKLERHEEAIRNFTFALELDSNNIRALIYRGVTYHYLNRYLDALHDYNRAIGHEPNDANLFIYRSSTYRHMRQFKDALKDLDSAIKLNPRLAHTILEKRGEVLQAMGNNYEALNIFIEALNTRQNCLECWLNLAKEYGNLHSWGEVPRLLREVKVVDEKDASVIACRGASMFYMNCYEEALIELNIAL